MLREALDIYRASGDVPSIVNTLLVAAFALMAEGRAETAAEISGAIDAMREPLGELATGLDILSIEDPKLEAHVSLGDAVFGAATQRGRSLDLEAAAELAFRDE